MRIDTPDGKVDAVRVSRRRIALILVGMAVEIVLLRTLSGMWLWVAAVPLGVLFWSALLRVGRWEVEHAARARR